MSKLIAVFDTSEQTLHAVSSLIAAGYSAEQMDIFTRQPQAEQQIEAGTDIDVNEEDSLVDGTLQGALAGGILGALGAGLFALGIVTTTVVGPALAVGPIGVAIAALAGSGVGSMTGALIDMGFAHEQAEGFEQYIDQNRILLILDCDTCDKAQTILSAWLV